MPISKLGLFVGLAARGPGRNETGSFPKRVSGPTTQNAAMTVDDQEGSNNKETHPGHLQGAMRGIHARYRGQEEKTPNGR